MRRVVAVLLGTWILWSTGCGDSAVQVGGRVTVDGVPVQKGNVTFHSVIPGGPLYYGEIGPDGRYTLVDDLKGARMKPGKYLATVRVVEVIESKNAASPPMPKLLTPPRYSDPETSGFEFTLAPGSNECDLKMTGK